MNKIEDEFPWGRIIADETIGPYTVRSYHPNAMNGTTITDVIDETKVEYTGYIDGEYGDNIWDSLDEALAGLIATRALGPNNNDIGNHFIAGVNALAAKWNAPLAS